jgi:sulfur-oxidizing protein SoxY
LIDRRAAIAGALALAAGPARATPERLAALVAEFTGGMRPAEGGVLLDIPPLVENGNAVPVVVAVDAGPGGARRIALFNERNPQGDVFIAMLGPRTAPRVATRIRLATTQHLVAVAELADGSFRMAQAFVVVTLAACVEG